MKILSRLRQHLEGQVDGASLAVFRAGFGGIMLWEVFRYFSYERVHNYYIEPKVYFAYLSFIRPLGGEGMGFVFTLLGVLAVCIAIGLFYRIASALFCVAFSYVFLLDRAQYLNHFYLVCLLALLLAIAPAHRALSLDRLRSRSPMPAMVPRWSLYALRAQITIVYFYGGVAKLNADWLLRGEPLGSWLSRFSSTPLIGPLLLVESVVLFCAWGAMSLDLFGGFLLWHRKTFPFAAAAFVVFHLLNSQIFHIGIFPWLMLTTIGLFARPDWPRRLFASRLASSRDTATRPSSSALPLVFLAGYFVAQLVVPLRHWVYPGDVAWNEEGHRFSWRMKLRDKETHDLAFYVSDPEKRGERAEVEIDEWLTDRQFDKMATRPDMIRDLARFIADRREAEVGVRPKVSVRVVTSLNGGPPQELVDPEADLGAVPDAPAWLGSACVPRSDLAAMPQKAPSTEAAVD